MSAPFKTQRAAALALLNEDPRTTRLTHKAGSFLGQCCTSSSPPLTDPQLEWMLALLERAGLPTLAMEAELG